MGEAKLKVQVLSHTPDFERNIARAGKLCYSSSGITELNDNLTDEEVTRYLNMILNVKHFSVLEHGTITFGIEGISRTSANQLVRHRIASYSQQSQRYVSANSFSYVVPQDIKNNPQAHTLFTNAMEVAQQNYNAISEALMEQYIIEYLGVEDKSTGMKYLEEELKKDTELWEDIGVDVLRGYVNLQAMFRYYDKKTYNVLTKRANENARAVLPNATETKIVVTMNVRALFNFFKERLCMRAQDEIREMAFEMWKCCMQISPTIFKYAVPTCVNGKCKEGKMSCGKMLEVKDRYNTEIQKQTKGEQ